MTSDSEDVVVKTYSLWVEVKSQFCSLRLSAFPANILLRKSYLKQLGSPHRVLTLDRRQTAYKHNHIASVHVSLLTFYQERHLTL